MKKLSLSIFFVLFTIALFAQNSAQDFVKEGIAYHDNGDYDKAIASYKKGLVFDPKSALINYELSFSYFKKGDYKETIKYADAVLKKKGDYMVQAYINKGSALDMLGKTKASIKLFEKALETTDKHYLLYYNLALNYYKIGDFENAEKNAINAIGQNSNHASSHLMLANIHDQKGDTVKTLLAVHYFLFLEPDSVRSKGAYQILQRNFSGNVTKDADKPNTINISFSPNEDDEFKGVTLMLSMLEASKTLDENKNKSDDELFVENTASFFKMLGELKDKKKTGFWWDFYVAFDYDLAKSDHLETYCKYISQSANENSQKWLTDNKPKLEAFAAWLHPEN